MPTILALDTSTEACSCALLHEGVIHERHELVPRQHAQLLLPMLKQLLDDHGLAFANLDAIAFGKGPGSFTGLRIAAGVTQGIAFGANLPVIPVSTLAALALQGANGKNALVFSCLDARIEEVYWGWYRVTEGQPELIAEEQLCQPEQLPVAPPVQTTPVIAAGNGLTYRPRMPAALVAHFESSLDQLLPRSGDIARIAAQSWERGHTIQPDAINPVYLRDKVTHQ
jgi:tRNA threonylcarbamoyladenosine biosynthesis protein TsaB